MRGKRLTVDEVKALPLGTKVVVFRNGGAWVIFQGERVEQTAFEEGIARTIDCEGIYSFVGGDEYFPMEYYQYTEGSSTNEETI